MKQILLRGGQKWKIIGVLTVITIFVVLGIRRLSGSTEHPPVAFYYWKQTYSLNHKQQSLLRSCKSEELFVKFFDVTHDPATGAKPVSIISFDGQPELHVIPCVYIQNEVFKHRQPELAKKILGLVQRIASSGKLTINELQIDCDWSGTTRNAYFQFLRSLRQLAPTLRITCTIRLHQIKYQTETGIPPVKKGVLMCYNMDDLDAFNVDNSIVAVSTLKKYITPTTSYPLELDLALPIYQWGLVFRLGKLSLIANDLSEKTLRSPDYRQIKPTVFQVRKNGYLNNTYVCKGDLIRLETSSPETLSAMAECLRESNLTFNRLILFHISQENTSQYHESNIQEIRHLIP